jgi:hypothetical protein
VFLESPDGAFLSLASMTVRRHQLISDIIDGEEILQSVDALLSRVWSFGLKPLTVSALWMLSYALAHSEADLDFMGTTFI